MVDIILKAFSVVSYHLGEEDHWLEQRGDHGLGEGDHFLHGQVLLLGKLGRPTEEKLELARHIGESNGTLLEEELEELEDAFELFRVSGVDQVGRGLGVPSQEQAADEFHIHLPLFLSGVRT